MFRRPDGGPLALAGLWSSWRDRHAEEEAIRTCAVITGPANVDVLPITYRMPIDLARDRIDAWLDPELSDVDTLQEMLRLLPAGSYRRSRMRGSATRRKTL